MEFLKTPILRTARLMLRPICAEDKEDMLDILTDAEIGKTFMLPVFDTREDAVGLFERFCAMCTSSAHFVYGIALDGKLIGFVNVVGADGKQAEIGYVISPPYCGKGFATEAASAAIGELFSLGLKTVAAGAFEENHASMRVMEKCGMHRTDLQETIEYRGNAHRCVYYQIDRQDNSKE